MQSFRDHLVRLRDVLFPDSHRETDAFGAEFFFESIVKFAGSEIEGREVRLGAIVGDPVMFEKPSHDITTKRVPIGRSADPDEFIASMRDLLERGFITDHIHRDVIGLDWSTASEYWTFNRKSQASHGNKHEQFEKFTQAYEDTLAIWIKPRFSIRGYWGAGGGGS